MSRWTLGAYFGLYPIGLRKAVLRVSKGYLNKGRSTLKIRNLFNEWKSSEKFARNTIKVNMFRKTSGTLSIVLCLKDWSLKYRVSSTFPSHQNPLKKHEPVARAWESNTAFISDRVHRKS